VAGTLTFDTAATLQAVLLIASGLELKFGSTEQDISARGERKWDVQAAITFHAEPGMNPVNEVITVTVTGHGTDPCASIPSGIRGGRPRHPAASTWAWSGPGTDGTGYAAAPAMFVLAAQAGEARRAGVVRVAIVPVIQTAALLIPARRWVT